MQALRILKNGFFRKIRQKSPRFRGDFRLFAAVVAAKVAAAAAAENEQERENVAKTSQSVTAATAQKDENQDEAVATAAATRITVCKKVHSMYLLKVLEFAPISPYAKREKCVKGRRKLYAGFAAAQNIRT